MAVVEGLIGLLMEGWLIVVSLLAIFLMAWDDLCRTGDQAVWTGSYPLEPGGTRWDPVAPGGNM